jgi:subtilisin-like proprotein convertase family protein
MLLAAVAVAIQPFDSMAQKPVQADRVWKQLHIMPERGSERRWIRPPRFKGFAADFEELRTVLAQAASEDVPRAKRAETIITLPAPNGELERFSVVESPVMEPELAAQFPSIRTYAAVGIDDPAARARLDITPNGFHAQVFSPRGNYFIDPYWRSDTTNYASYYVRDYRVAGKTWTCGVVSDAPASPTGAAGVEFPADLARQNGATLRKYRVAVAAQGEYTEAYGGTVTGALAGIVTTINRVTQLYENDLAIRLVLVAGNASIIYTNATTDPYPVNDSTSAILSTNQYVIDLIIGNANYDIGHVVNTGGGGLASLGVVCISGFKARGSTGSDTPYGDPFDIDYVAHEMGHQFGAEHTFNGVTGSCSGGNRNDPTAYEPGSGSTIMAYAGICGTDNLQAHSDAYFHFASITQILGYVETDGTCSTNTATGNTPPTVNAGGDYSIPKGTPFMVTASGSDGDGDMLTYCWEERDLGSGVLGQALGAADDGSSPLFRSFSPTTNAWRMFPRLSNILNNVSTSDEELPAFARTMTLRCTVRDNRSDGGGINADEVQITVATSGPFAVTSFGTTGTISGSATVNWSVANTTLSPVNASNVHIRLSTDGGATFPTWLASNTPNDGTQVVALPNAAATNVRIRVEGAGNIFFDINNAPMTLASALPYFTGAGSNAVDDSAGNSSGGPDPGESGVKLFIRIRNDGLSTGTGISATLTSLTALASVNISTAAYPNIAAGASASNASAFVLSLSSSLDCADAIPLRLQIAAAESTNTVDLSLSLGAVSVVTNAYTATAGIPDNTPAGVDVTFAVTNSGTIADVDFSFDGTSCSTVENWPLVGVTHSYVGDLIVTLTSPEGTTITLMNRIPNGAGGNGGNNLCSMRFNDDGSFSNIQTAASGSAPFSKTWLPNEALSAFDGEEQAGTWTLNVSDHVAVDTGTVRAFSLIVSTRTCSPVTNAPDADTDGDLIPDDWETAYGLNPAVSNAPLSDTDSDGVTDLNEYIADTHPTNGASFLRLSVISNAGPRSVLFGPSSTGRVYTLQYIDNLLNGAWSNATQQAPGDGTSSDALLDTNAAPASRHYRIGVKLP